MGSNYFPRWYLQGTIPEKTGYFKSRGVCVILIIMYLPGIKSRYLNLSYTQGGLYLSGVDPST